MNSTVSISKYHITSLLLSGQFVHIIIRRNDMAEKSFDTIVSAFIEFKFIAIKFNENEIKERIGKKK